MGDEQGGRAIRGRAAQPRHATRSHHLRRSQGAPNSPLNPHPPSPATVPHQTEAVSRAAAVLDLVARLNTAIASALLHELREALAAADQIGLRCGQTLLEAKRLEAALSRGGSPAGGSSPGATGTGRSSTAVGEATSAAQSAPDDAPGGQGDDADDSDGDEGGADSEAAFSARHTPLLQAACKTGCLSAVREAVADCLIAWQYTPAGRSGRPLLLHALRDGQDDASRGAEADEAQGAAAAWSALLAELSVGCKALESAAEVMSAMSSAVGARRGRRSSVLRGGAAGLRAVLRDDEDEGGDALFRASPVAAVASFASEDGAMEACQALKDLARDMLVVMDAVKELREAADAAQQ